MTTTPTPTDEQKRKANALVSAWARDGIDGVRAYELARDIAQALADQQLEAEAPLRNWAESLEQHLDAERKRAESQAARITRLEADQQRTIKDGFAKVAEHETRIGELGVVTEAIEHEWRRRLREAVAERDALKVERDRLRRDRTTLRARVTQLECDMEERA